MIEIAPSILAADFARLGQQVAAVAAGGAAIIHVDVMDGRFVPNISLGPPIVASLRQATDLMLDCHLMIVEPERYLEAFRRAGADAISVHVEAVPHLQRTLAQIHELGAQAGIAINPATPLGLLEEILPEADFVLVMSVNPGFGGQRFLRSALDKVRRLRAMIAERGLAARIAVDGGVDRTNVRELVTAGAEQLIAGSAVFGADEPARAVEELRRLASSSEA